MISLFFCFFGFFFLFLFLFFLIYFLLSICCLLFLFKFFICDRSTFKELVNQRITQLLKEVGGAVPFKVLLCVVKYILSYDLNIFHFNSID